MKFINKFFIGLMAISLASTILAFCLDQTLLKADFVTAQADKSGIYTDLAQQLPKQVAGSSDNSPAVQAALARVVTPEFMKNHLDAYIHNLESAYRSGAAVPPLDLTEVIPRAEALGVQLSAQDKADLTKNLTIQTGNLGKPADISTTNQPANAPISTAPGPGQIYHRAAQAKWLLLLASVILAGLVFISGSHHRLKALAHGLLSTAGWLLGYYAFFRIAPGIANHQLKTAKDFSLGGSVGKLVTLAAGGVAIRLLYAAAGTAAIGILLWLAGTIMPHFGRSKSGPKGDSRTPLPDVFHKN